MLMKNLDPGRGLFNGARGVVTNFVYTQENNSRVAGIEVDFFSITSEIKRYIITPTKICVWESPRNSVFEVYQFPLRICYISTSHKTQGLTLDEVYIDIGEDAFPFAHGSFYVVLSRVRRLENLHFFGRLMWPENGIQFHVNPFIIQNETFLREREAHRPTITDHREQEAHPPSPPF
jgi:ATP-dependent exoDNAse (exonuclease V) alpha subunit